MPATNANRAAFSLVELMFVLAIMAILATVATLSLTGSAERAKEDKTKMNLQTVGSALKLYQVRYNAYPPTSMGQQALVATSYLDNVVRDGWDQEFAYTAPTINFPNGFEIISAGKDGQFNTADDIRLDPTTEQ